jgi:hypothetical protein
MLNQTEMYELMYLIVMVDIVDIRHTFYKQRKCELMMKATPKQKEACIELSYKVTVSEE